MHLNSNEKVKIFNIPLKILNSRPFIHFSEPIQIKSLDMIGNEMVSFLPNIGRYPINVDRLVLGLPQSMLKSRNNQPKPNFTGNYNFEELGQIQMITEPTWQWIVNNDEG